MRTGGLRNHRLCLFTTEWSSITSVVISMVTNTGFSHAGVLTESGLVDASEARGSVGINPQGLVGYRKRYVLVLNIKSQKVNHGGEGWLVNQLGRRYDWKGVLSWLLPERVKSKRGGKTWYCFSFVMEYIHQVTGEAVSDGDVSAISILSHPHVHIEYFGPARDYTLDGSA